MVCSAHLGNCRDGELSSQGIHVNVYFLNFFVGPIYRFQKLALLYMHSVDMLSSRIFTDECTLFHRGLALNGGGDYR